MKTKQTLICGLLAVMFVLTFGAYSAVAQELRLTGQTDIFSFTRIKGGNEYSVSAGKAATGAVDIPAYYRLDAESDYLPVTEIGMGGFKGRNITSVTIPSTVTSIGLSAFENCRNLVSITVPSSVTSIGQSAFNACINLTSITILTNVTSIGYYAFMNCTSLTSVTIPASGTRIRDFTFMNCTSLASITLPEGVTIDFKAFSGCTGIKEITIPRGATLREQIFEGWFTSQTIYIEGHANRASTIAAKWHKDWDKDTTYPQEIPTYAKIVYQGK